MGGGHHAHVHRHRVGRAHRAHLALLQHAQEAHLKGRRGLANLVQKHGAAVGALEQARVVFIGAGEGAALVAKEFRLQQRVRHGRAVLHHKGAGCARAGVVHGARQEFFAGAGLAQYQHAQVVARHAFGHFADGVQRAAGCALDAVEIKHAARLGELGLCALAQHRGAGAQLQVQAVGVALQVLRLHRIAHRGQQVVGHPGFEDVLVNAGLVDAGNDVFRIGIARDDDAHRVRPALAHLFQKQHAGQARHALVAQDHADGVVLHADARGIGIAGGEHHEVFVQGAAHGLLGADLVVHHQHAG